MGREGERKGKGRVRRKGSGAAEGRKGEGGNGKVKKGNGERREGWEHAPIGIFGDYERKTVHQNSTRNMWFRPRSSSYPLGARGYLQRDPSHAVFSTVGGHASPPLSGATITGRVRCLTPGPHRTSHSPQSRHGPTSQSTAAITKQLTAISIIMPPSYRPLYASCPSVCPSLPYGLVTRNTYKNQHWYKCFQGTSKWSANFQLKRSKVKVTGRRKSPQQSKSLSPSKLTNYTASFARGRSCNSGRPHIMSALSADIVTCLITLCPCVRLSSARL